MYNEDIESSTEEENEQNSFHQSEDERMSEDDDQYIEHDMIHQQEENMEENLSDLEFVNIFETQKSTTKQKYQ